VLVGLGSAVAGGTVTLTGDTTIRVDGALTLPAVSGDFDLTKVGGGELTLSTASPNFGGVLIVGEGRVRVGNAQALGSAATGDGTVVLPGATLEANFNGDSAEPLTLNGAGVQDRGALFVIFNPTFIGPVTLTGDTTVGLVQDLADGAGGVIPGGTVDFRTGIDGPGRLTLEGNRVTFSGPAPNTYGGGTAVGPAANLRLNKTPGVTALPGALDVQSSGAVTVASAEQIPDDLPLTLGGSGSGGVFIVNAPETVGPLTLNGGVDVHGNGLILGGDVTVNASTTLTNVRLSLGRATRTFTVADGVNFSMAGGFNSVLTGDPGAGLIKAGPGTMSLAVNNFYTGPTTVAGGVLQVSPAVVPPGPVTVTAGGTLQAATSDGPPPRTPLGDITSAGGTVTPGIDVRFGTSLLPGTGVLTANGDVAFDAATTFRVDARGPNAGTEVDQLRVTGGGTIDLGNARLDLRLVQGFSSTVGSAFVIVRNDSANPTVGQFTRPDGSPLGEGERIQVADPQGNVITFEISYRGVDGQGDDVVLFHRNTPSQAEDLALTPDGAGGAVLTGRLTDPDRLDALTLTVDWGDGSPVQTVTDVGRDPFHIPHQYAEAGTYTARVGWFDQHGGGFTRDLTVQAARPLAVVESVVVNDGAAQRSAVSSVTVTIRGRVTFAPGAFELVRQDGTAIDVAVASSEVVGRTVAVLTFTGPDVIGGSLADGNYTLTIRGDRVTDAVGLALDGDGNDTPGGDRVERFFRLFGDTDGDRDVDKADRDRFRAAFRSQAGDPDYVAALDFDADGDIDRADRRQFNRRRGTVLSP
jgi:autotransporter-associated beta strand protein